MTRVLRWICDPDKLEAIEGDLAELYGERWSWRYGRDVVSLCMRLPRTAIRSFVAAVVVLALVGPVAPRVHYTVYGADFHIAIKPEGGIEWYPRRSVSH